MNTARSPLTRALAHTLRQTRIARDISYRRAVAASGVSLSQLQRIEKAEADIDMDELSRLSSAYGVRASQVLREAEQMVVTLGLGDMSREDEVAALEESAE